MYSRSFNIVKWGTFSQKASIHRSEVNVLKKLQLSEVRFITQEASIHWSNIHVLNNLSYSDEILVHHMIWYTEPY